MAMAMTMEDSKRERKREKREKEGEERERAYFNLSGGPGKSVIEACRRIGSWIALEISFHFFSPTITKQNHNTSSFKTLHRTIPKQWMLI